MHVGLARTRNRIAEPNYPPLSPQGDHFYILLLPTQVEIRPLGFLLRGAGTFMSHES